MDPCSNQSSRRVGSLSHDHLDRGGWMTTAGLFFNKMSRRSRSFAPGRAAARLRCCGIAAGVERRSKKRSAQGVYRLNVLTMAYPKHFQPPREARRS